MADNQSVKDTPEELRQNDSNTNEKEPKQKSIKLIIKRQDNQDSKPYEETFEIPYKENMNVIACLMEIRRNPVNNKGEKTTPVTWDMNCLEEVCGACSMVINGRARQSCS
ncbi:succinate dehydrogenase iron-sulfur subunit, partial [Staphylococcus haemolyticus]